MCNFKFNYLCRMATNHSAFHIQQIPSIIVTWPQIFASWNGHILDGIRHPPPRRLSLANARQTHGVISLSFSQNLKSSNEITFLLFISFVTFRFIQYYSVDVLCFCIAVLLLLKFLFKRYFIKSNTTSNAKLKIQ